MSEGIDWLSFGLGALSGLMVALLFHNWWRRRRSLSQFEDAQTGPVNIPAALHGKIRLLRAEGRDLEAIRIIRKETGCDLAAARAAVLAFR